MFPILLKLPFATLHTYGMLLSLAFLVGVYTASRFAKKEGMDSQQVLDLGIWVAFSALVGAKLLLLVEDFNFYLANPGEIFSLSFFKAGGVFYGGFLMAVAVAILFCVKHRLNLWAVMDAFAPGIVLGHAIGRLGCFSAGCCWGKPTHLPWAVTFTNPYSHEIVGVPLNLPLHPTQLYEAFANTMIFLFLWRRYRHKRFPGQIFSLYLLSYAAWRFFVEFWRDHEVQGLMWGGALSIAQFIALLSMVSALILYVVQSRNSAVRTNVPVSRR